jgi:hypothetical protein
VQKRSAGRRRLPGTLPAPRPSSPRARGTSGEQRGGAARSPQAFEAATFGAEFTGALPDEPDPELLLPEPEPEPELLLPVLGVEVVPEELSGFAAGLDSPPSDFGLLEE